MIEFSIETIHHFKCSYCKSLFSIADFHKVTTELNPDGEPVLNCPICFLESEIKEIKND